MPPLEEEIRRFIIDNFLYGEDNDKLGNNDSLLELGLIDSTGALELVAFLEGKYGIAIDDNELDPTNLDSINKVVQFINRKTQASCKGKTEGC
jgi:acyl carrier protein